MTEAPVAPQPAQHERGSLRPGLILAVLVAGVAYAWLSGALGSIVPNVAPGHCTVGLNGAAVSVSVDGPGAVAQCRSFLSQTTDGGTWYVYANSQQPAGAMICQVNYAGVAWSVRDQGVLNIYGSSICQQLIALANGQASP